MNIILQTRKGFRFCNDGHSIWRYISSSFKNVTREPFLFQIIKKNGKITAKFQSLNRVLVEVIKGFMPPEKRLLRTTGLHCGSLDAKPW